MKQQIIAFHQDTERAWVADLTCGHTQHVHHDPPWQTRVWVTTTEGREAFLGAVPECNDCDEASASSL